MKNLKEKKQKIIRRTVVMPVLLSICMILIFFAGIIRFHRIGQEQELALARDALKKAVIQCYAIEGVYPADVNYLKENYYLSIDEKKYDIFYDCFSSNIMPEYDVFEK